MNSPDFSEVADLLADGDFDVLMRAAEWAEAAAIQEQTPAWVYLFGYCMAHLDMAARRAELLQQLVLG